VALYRVTDTAGRVRTRLAPSWAAIDTIPGAQRVWAVNLVGRLAGSDPTLAGEHILVDAHYDHIGVAGRFPEPVPPGGRGQHLQRRR
jgi:hypothetical protein